MKKSFSKYIFTRQSLRMLGMTQVLLTAAVKQPENDHRGTGGPVVHKFCGFC